MKVCLISLGCDKNSVDSEKFLYTFKNYFRDSIIVSDINEADFAIVNTCAFINDAKIESIKTLKSLIKRKKKNPNFKILAIGCLVRDIREFSRKSKVDKYCDAVNLEAGKLLKDIDFTLSVDEYTSEIDKCLLRIKDDLSYSSYLKISEGCRRCCSYCRIPHIRGRYRSVPMEKLVNEALYMAENGIKELVLVAQETTCYGKDLYGKKCLHELISKLAKIDGIEWIRIMYCYPEEIYDELIETFVKEPKLVHYIDMPLQHSEDNILKRMGRRTDKQSIIKVIEKLRNKVPDIAIRTSSITGFPGETKEDHDNLMEFLDEMELDRVGVFTYSKEDGTPAA